MDVHITYETLFDLLRKERSLQELQTLDMKFWRYVLEYIKERENVSVSAKPGEQEKARIQLQNVKRILKEIYERRERKILNLALNVIRTETAGYVDTKNMLAEEKALFDETLALLKKYKDGVLTAVFNNELPTVVPYTHYDDEKVVGDGFGGPAPETDSSPADSVSDSKNDSGEVDLAETDTGERSDSNVVEDTPVDQVRNDTSGNDEGVIVKFVTAVPKFYGKNKEIYGPYAKKQIVTLPANIANILLKKGKVEKVINE